MPNIFQRIVKIWSHGEVLERARGASQLSPGLVALRGGRETALAAARATRLCHDVLRVVGRWEVQARNDPKSRVPRSFFSATFGNIPQINSNNLIV